MTVAIDRGETAIAGAESSSSSAPVREPPSAGSSVSQVREARRRSSVIDSLENVRPQTLQRQGGAT